MYWQINNWFPESWIWLVASLHRRVVPQICSECKHFLKMLLLHKSEIDCLQYLYWGPAVIIPTTPLSVCSLWTLFICWNIYLAQCLLCSNMSKTFYHSSKIPLKHPSKAYLKLKAALEPLGVNAHTGSSRITLRFFPSSQKPCREGGCFYCVKPFVLHSVCMKSAV